MKIYQRIYPHAIHKSTEIYDDDGNELDDVVSIDYLDNNRVRLTHQHEVDYDNVELIFLEEDALLPSEKLKTELA